MLRLPRLETSTIALYRPDQFVVAAIPDLPSTITTLRLTASRVSTDDLARLFRRTPRLRVLDLRGPHSRAPKSTSAAWGSSIWNNEALGEALAPLAPTLEDLTLVLKPSSIGKLPGRRSHVWLEVLRLFVALRRLRIPTDVLRDHRERNGQIWPGSFKALPEELECLTLEDGWYPMWRASTAIDGSGKVFYDEKKGIGEGEKLSSQDLVEAVGERIADGKLKSLEKVRFVHVEVSVGSPWRSMSEPLLQQRGERV